MLKGNLIVNLPIILAGIYRRFAHRINPPSNELYVISSRANSHQYNGLTSIH